MQSVGTPTDPPVPDEPDQRFIDAARARQVQMQLIDEDRAVEMAETFRVLSDPTRVRLISALAAGELCVADLARVVGISQSATSHQLRVLRHLDLVNFRRVGKLVYYSLDNHTLGLFQQGLAHVEDWL
jgi:DNA-binding transcriptional ArsR family regulator